MQNIIEMWIAQGASENEARMLAKMYGAPKASDPFLARWNIHREVWQNVKCKANVKKVVAAVEKAGREISAIYISPAFGSVYIDIISREDALDTDTIRVSNHERTSEEYGRPAYNVFNRESLKATLIEIAA